MVPVASGTLEAEACPGCRGLWFRDASLRQGLGSRFDRDRVLRVTVAQPCRRACPECGQALTAHLHSSPLSMIELDHCAACRGFFLDHGELEKIRAGLGLPDLSHRPWALRPRRVRTGDGDSARAHYQAMEQARGIEATAISWPSYFFVLLSQLPVEVHTPRRYFPWVLFGIVGLCSYGFWATLAAYPHHQAFVAEWAAIPNRSLLPDHWYQLVTSMFLHGSVPHLLGNCYFLWIFGDNVYDVFLDHGWFRGPLLFLAFYLTTGVLASLAHCLLALTDPQVAGMPLVGASGAISAILAAYWRLFPGSRLYQILFFKAFKIPVWVYFLFWILGNLLIASELGVRAPVSWEAHLGGFLAGYLLLPAFLPHPLASYHRAPEGASTR